MDLERLCVWEDGGIESRNVDLETVCMRGWWY